jgi:hypothetical protein
MLSTTLLAALLNCRPRSVSLLSIAASIGRICTITASMSS